METAETPSTPEKPAAKRITYYVHPHVQPILLKPESLESTSGRISYLALLAHKSAIQAAPAFTANEWCAMADALNGHYANYEMAPDHLLKSAWHSVFDSAEEATEKWSVNTAELAQRLARLSILEQAGVFEIIRLFWIGPQQGNSWTEIFVSLGAKIKN